MAYDGLFDKIINDSFHLQFTRNDNAKETITWETWLTNTKSKKKLMLDSYTLKKVPMSLGDPMRIASGEDMIFHHNLANAILIEKTLFVVHNMQGQIFLRQYHFSSEDKLSKSSFYLASYSPVPSLAYGYQYADFFHSGNELFILVNAGCRMTQQNQRADWLFKFNLAQKKVLGIAFDSKEKSGQQSIKVTTKENPFLTMDIKAEKIVPAIKAIVIDVLNKHLIKRSPYPYKYLGALENMDSKNDISNSMHQRATGTLYFFYQLDERVHIARFRLSALLNSWLLNDFHEIVITGKPGG